MKKLLFLLLIFLLFNISSVYALNTITKTDSLLTPRAFIRKVLITLKCAGDVELFDNYNNIIAKIIDEQLILYDNDISVIIEHDIYCNEI